jgi:hypothetical protein
MDATEQCTYIIPTLYLLNQYVIKAVTAIRTMTDCLQDYEEQSN